MLSARLVRDAFSIIEVGHPNSTGSASPALLNSTPPHPARTFNFIRGAKKHGKYSEAAGPDISLDKTEKVELHQAKALFS